jgi:hypothetical protein
MISVGPFSKDILFEDIAQGCLGIDGKDEHLLPLFREVVCRGCGKRGLAQASLAAEHDVMPVRILFEYFCQ